MKPLDSHCTESSRRCAFTLIELLTVIAIIGILAGILIPTIGAVKASANKAKSKAEFSQWATAYGLFKQEYGYYPRIGTPDKGSTLLSTNAHAESFAQTLTGRKLNGELVTGSNDNKKRISFFSLSSGSYTEESSPKLQDAFGNTEICIIFDYNNDGLITADDGSFHAVKSVDSSTSFTPASPVDFPNDGIRAGVIVYSAGKDGTSRNAIMTWK